MIQFDYDGIMKKYNVKVPLTLKNKTSNVTVASISEDNRITLHRQLSIDLVNQIIMHWHEYEHQLIRQDELIDNNKKGE